jgi:hypothetical protein
MSFSLWASALAFFLIEGDALHDQLAIGHASAIFILGTACLTVAACAGLFAILMAIGLAVSAAFSDEPAAPPSPGPSDGADPVDHRSDQRANTSVKPVAR